MKAILSFALTALFAITSSPASAAELVTNGGFETGNHTGWTVVNASNGYWTWAVTPPGGGNTDGTITTSSPRSGLYSSHGGFCCNSVNNPEYIQQQVVLPAATTLTLKWSDKIQSDLATFCSSAATCGSNVWRVQILNTSNTVLQTLYTFTATAIGSYNTGWVDHQVNISSFAGQTIRLRFSATYTSAIGGNMNGPGRAELDRVSIQTPTAADVAVTGRVLNSYGLGVRAAVVKLVDSRGNMLTAMTNAFGYYSFASVPTGDSYVSNVTVKGAVYAPRVVTVTDSVTGFDFSPQ